MCRLAVFTADSRSRCIWGVAAGSHQGEELLSLLWLGQCRPFVIEMAIFVRSQLQEYLLYSADCLWQA